MGDCFNTASQPPTNLPLSKTMRNKAFFRIAQDRSIEPKKDFDIMIASFEASPTTLLKPQQVRVADPLFLAIIKSIITHAKIFDIKGI